MEWVVANRQYLNGEIERVLDALHDVTRDRPHAERPPPAPLPLPLPTRPPALQVLTTALGLTPFERDVVVACVAAELAPAFEQRTGAAWPTLHHLTLAFEHHDRDALDPHRPLRAFGIVTPGEGVQLVHAPLAIDPYIASFLKGADALDFELAPFAQRLPVGRGDSESVERIVTLCARTPAAAPSLIGLVGGDEHERVEVATAVGAALDLALYRVHASDLPIDLRERAALRDRWERARRLHRLALLVELGDDPAPELARVASTWLGATGGLVFVASRRPIAIAHAHFLRVEIAPAARATRLAQLERALGPHGEDLAPLLRRITAQFTLTTAEIERACLAARSAPGPLAERLWAACRTEARPQIDDIARRIDARATWADLVVPEPTYTPLRELASQIRNRTTVHETWRLGTSTARGLGTSALLWGPPGTGKTMAAEVLATDAGLDLFHIDLSQVVNKYVGETEKNLNRIFDAAEGSGAILLFDEADALFGKRGDVDRAADRYANVEVSFLLQRMEQYSGVALLTTNRREALDGAFSRRLRFVIAFGFPDVPYRQAMWQRAFPPTAPTRGLDYGKLASLQASGGDIRSIALNAAFIAAEAGEPISMQHIARASKAEFEKHNRVFPHHDVAAW